MSTVLGRDGRQRIDRQTRRERETERDRETDKTGGVRIICVGTRFDFFYLSDDTSRCCRRSPWNSTCSRGDGRQWLSVVHPAVKMLGSADIVFRCAMLELAFAELDLVRDRLSAYSQAGLINIARDFEERCQQHIRRCSRY